MRNASQGSKLCPGDWNPSPPGPNWAATITGSFSYTWNVDDHPWIVDGGGVIWNGDEPFISVNNGTIASIRIDDRAILRAGVANPLLVLDRDMGGEAIASHEAAGNYGVALPGQYATVCNGVPLTGTGDSNSQPRRDGIWDGVNMIQGVRAYDTAIGQWTTPDVFKGHIEDPMSQQPYMWNRNNPDQYSDPTGYDALEILSPSRAMNLGHLKIVIYDPKTGRGTEWTQGPVHEMYPHDREAITKTPIADIRAYAQKVASEGNIAHHITQSPEQDAKETAYAQRRFDMQSSMNYNAISNNCAEFVGDVMMSGGWGTGASLYPNLNGVFWSESWNESWTGGPTIPAAGAKG